MFKILTFFLIFAIIIVHCTVYQNEQQLTVISVKMRFSEVIRGAVVSLNIYEPLQLSPSHNLLLLGVDRMVVTSSII